MKMKRALAGLLAAAIVLGGAYIPASDNGNVFFDTSVNASAAVYGDYEYTVLANKTIEITRYNGSDKNIDIPSVIDGKKVTSIGNKAFEFKMKIVSVNIPECVTNIGDNAFYYCNSLESINIPEEVTNIGNYAFYCCSSLKSVTIPEKVTNIGDEAFYNCYSIKEVRIPAGVTSIGENVFFDCRSLESITVDPANERYNSKDGVLFEKNELIQYPTGNTAGSYTVPNGTTVIRKYAFFDCKNLTDVKLSNKVTSIEQSAFEQCENIKNITLSNSLKNIGETAFSLCISLTNVKIPDGVTTIGNDAFAKCNSLKSVTIPASMTNINDYAFKVCPELASVTINSSTVKIAKNVFYYSKKVSIKCVEGSSAEQYAKDNNIPYEYISGVKKDISDCTITLGADTNYFRGTRIRPVVTVADGEEVLRSGNDYTVTYLNNLSVGTATIKITGKRKYSGTVTKTFDIVQRSISNCNVVVDTENCNFSGSRIKPSVKVYTNGIEMYSGNYTLSYSNNLSAGTASVTLTGKNNLKGKVTKNFRISPESIDACTISFAENTENKYEPKVIIKLNGNIVYNGNYDVTYKTSDDSKTVDVTIKGKNNLSGSVSRTYVI